MYIHSSFRTFFPSFVIDFIFFTFYSIAFKYFLQVVILCCEHKHIFSADSALFLLPYILICRDPYLVKRIGAATALEMRATGFPYAFAPCIAVSRSRTLADAFFYFLGQRKAESLS